MKSLITVLPFDIAPDSIPLALPLLLAQMEKAKINVKGIDFNAELYNKILTPKYFKECIKNIKKEYEILKTKTNFNEAENQKKKIYEKIINNPQKIKYLINNFSRIKKEYLNKEISLGTRIPKEIIEILKVAFAPFSQFAPWKSFSYSYNYSEIVDFADSKDNNIFYNFLLKYGHKYNFNQYDFVGVSLPFENSIYYAFTLGKYIKETTKNTKVVFGGAIITRLWDDFIKFPQIFDKYCDNIIVGDGDKAIIEYSNYIKGKVSEKEVSGLVYRDSNGILQKNPVDNIEINSIMEPSYKKINLKNYPKNVLLNIQFSRGCPWGKCAFCTFSYPYRTKFSILDVKSAVDMLENLVRKYKIKDFYIIDETLTFRFFVDFAKEIIKRDIKIKYDCRLRFSNQYTYEIFNLLAQSGLRSIFWGYEAESERILKIMNKGIDYKTRTDILKNAKQAGIINKLGFIFGFPGETENEIWQTINFIKDNYKKIFDRFSISIFSLEKNSYIIREPEKYGICNISKKSDFSIGHYYSDNTISRERVYQLIDFCLKTTDEKTNT